MASPLSGSLARTIGRAISPLFLPAVLVRDIPGEADPAQPWNPVSPTPASYPCKAIVEEYAEKFRLEGLVEQSDRKVLVLANSLSIDPAANDRITIRGETFTVIAVATDPAKATWELRARA